ncbi:MAG: nucleoid-associated protein [Gammaproteobacteria bacterium]|nr:nucleoid-associated protein [Gammaproteobacteria bacterium]
MIDISSACINKLIVHQIGNKIRDEGYNLSENEAERTATLDELLLKHYLAPVIRKGDVYDFSHESELSLNTIYHFASLIFEDQTAFKSHTQSIAKHLYSASTHPNIGGGEFIVILFDDIKTEDGAEQALGLFRIEGKSDYLEVEDQNGSLSVIERMGISLDKIQKGAITFSGGRKVYVVDSLGQKTKYWLESFLKAVPSETPKACAKAAGAFLKAVADKVTSPADSLELGQRIQESLSEAESLSIPEIKDLSTSYLDEEEVNGILAGIQEQSGLDINDDLAVDTKQLSKYTRDVVKKTRITEGVNLVISNRHAHVSSVDVKETETGMKATIDIQFMEN